MGIKPRKHLNPGKAPNESLKRDFKLNYVINFQVPPSRTCMMKKEQFWATFCMWEQGCQGLKSANGKWGSFTAGEERIRESSARESGRRLVLIWFSFKSNVLLNHPRERWMQLWLWVWETEEEGEDWQQDCPWPETPFFALQKQRWILSCAGSALCRGAWRRQASNTGQDKGYRKLLQSVTPELDASA